MNPLFFILILFMLILVVWYNLFKRSFTILNNPSLLEQFFMYVIKKVKQRNSRILALKRAERYIQPYENIFSNLFLSNKFCTIKLDAKNKLIKLRSKVYNEYGAKLCTTAYLFKKGDENECFNHLCLFFGYKTTYEESFEIIKEYASCKTEVVEKQEKVEEISPSFEQPKEQPVVKTIIERDFSEKIDINNSSESELIGLPGINIVLAKKIIKFREEEHQFYSVEEFLRVMKIKPHFAKQLRDLVIVKKINIQKVKKAKRERIIDL